MEQLELALEDLQGALAEAGDAPADDVDEPDPVKQAAADSEPNKQRRRPKVSKDTPRERRELDPTVVGMFAAWQRDEALT